MKALSNSSVCPKCGDGHKSRPFCNYANGQHCFSCGYTKSSDRGYYVVSEPANNIPEYPDATTDWSKFSLDAQIWLTQYGIDDIIARKYDIMCNGDCLIFPTFDLEGHLISYQKRKMSERYITTHGEKSPYLLVGAGNTVIVVEDYISAIKVHMAGYSSLCLWGTKLSRVKLQELFTLFPYCLVWLDNDTEKETNSGQKAAKHILNMGNYIIMHKYGYSGLNRKLKNVVTEKDPKYYGINQIKKLVEETLYG